MRKVIAQRLHAKQRFKERFGLTLTTAQLDSMVKIIRCNQARFVKKQSVRVAVWEVPYDGKIFTVVYDRKRKTIVTVLPYSSIHKEVVYANVV